MNSGYDFSKQTSGGNNSEFRFTLPNDPQASDFSFGTGNDPVSGFSFGSDPSSFPFTAADYAPVPEGPPASNSAFGADTSSSSFPFTPGHAPLPDDPQAPNFTSGIKDFPSGTDPSRFPYASAYAGPSTELTHQPRSFNFVNNEQTPAIEQRKSISQWDLAVSSAKPTEASEGSTPWDGGLKYTQLSASSSSFRLLVLEPSTAPDAKLEGWLFASSLDSHPVYETLSYVWGDRTSRDVIKLRELKVAKSKFGQGRRRWTGPSVEFKITPSLALALRQLRHPLISRTLWVDCICINQQDNDERSSQVQQMARIYKQGSRSMVWLGADEANRYGAVLQLLKELSKEPLSYEHEIRLQRRIWEQWNLEQGGKGFEDSSAEGLNQQVASRDIQQWITDFFDKRPLWNRIWIMQEIVFAPHPFILCGSSSMPWEVLGACIGQHNSHLSFVLRNSPSWEHAKMINQRRDQLTAQKQPTASNYDLLTIQKQPISSKSDLLSLFLRCQSFQSSDPRDMLYALLNLTDENPGVKPNYNISSTEMWIAFGKALMAHTKCLILLYQDESILTVSDRNLPSWISYSRNPSDFWFHPTPNHDSADFSNGYAPEEYDVAHTMLKYLPVTAVFLDVLENDRDPDYPFYRLYPSKYHHSFWHSTEVDQNYSSAKDLMQDCLKEFLPTHLNRIQTTSSSSKNTEGIPETLAISGHRKLTADEIKLYKEKKKHQKWDLLALSEMIANTKSMPDRLRRLRFEITPKGFPALLPPSARNGDKLAILFGCSIPMVLRALGDFNGTESYAVIGQAFVHGADRGQAVHPDSIRGEEYLWRGPLIHGLDELSWVEKKAAIRRARIGQWKALGVEMPRLVFLG